MANGKNQISEVELSALLDGELEPDRAAEVLAAVVRDPRLAEQFGQLTAISEGLRTLERDVLTEPVPDWINDLVSNAERD